MKKPLNFLLIIVFVYCLCGCNKDDETVDVVAPISTDISISTSQSFISWVDSVDLLQKLNNALSYNYGNANETETEKQQSFNVDTTQVIATINFKTAFQNAYSDINPSNNSVTIQLEKNIGVELKADGPGGTYSLITSVLAPGYNPIEAPDCSHNAFGEHIDEIFDNELNANVFRFFIHTTPDDDRCINFDRQRNEIKSYDQSPDNLLGTENETVVYNWKFKLNSGFQSSPNFTHLHQLKSVGGDLSSHPMYTLTTRKSNPDRLELRYGETDSSIILKQTDLAPFIATWLEVTETITYGTNGTYDIEIKKVNDGTTLFTYSNNSINNWRPNATFVRPKWGIYRSLINVGDLRDEEVLFADFKITEIE
ncbi:hypothetical protein [Olleya sp. YS]|uniref:hypothetical protein n=1 Tax=Olleya sp. YS TaxID=3028318 RepID=UPI0024342CA8|nr:hypothetical protein [Olleya sp. YS]WGD36033.1 hypothetical protein Ollyesu_06350 [Olleya sp. YS]